MLSRIRTVGPATEITGELIGCVVPVVRSVIRRGVALPVRSDGHGDQRIGRDPGAAGEIRDRAAHRHPG